MARKNLNSMAAFPHIDDDEFVLVPLKLPLDPLFDIDVPNASVDDRLRSPGSPIAFSIKTLYGAIHLKCAIDAIKSYNQSYQASTKAIELLSSDGWPVL